MADSEVKNTLSEDDIKRKLKNESLLTAGCGYGRSKKRLLKAFWEKLWPFLTSKVDWKKEEGEIGETLFIPPGVDIKTGRKGHDYYTRLRPLLDRILKRKNPQEKEGAEIYLIAVGLDKDSKTDHPQKSNTRKTRTVVTSTTTGTTSRRRGRPPKLDGEDAEGSSSTSKSQPSRLDLSWKTAGRSFPKMSSRVGDKYQVAELPVVGSYNNAPKADAVEQGGSEPEEILHDQIWDPKRATEAGAMDFIHTAVASNKKEAAVAILHELDYKTDNLLDRLLKVEALDGSNWTEKEKEEFHKEIFRLRKNIPLLSKSMNMSICNAFTYYLGTFKKSDNYRLLKTVCCQERALKQAASDQGLDACVICGDGGSLLICDGCEGEYHMTCLSPRLAAVPEGDWQCDDCVNRQFLEARDYLIRNSTIYERVEDKKRKMEEIESVHSDVSTGISTRSGGMRRSASSASLRSEQDAGTILLRPHLDVVKAIRLMADSIDKAFSTSNISTRTSAKPQKEIDSSETESKICIGEQKYISDSNEGSRTVHGQEKVVMNGDKSTTVTKTVTNQELINRETKTKLIAKDGNLPSDDDTSSKLSDADWETPEASCILPDKFTKKLYQKIRKLSKSWLDEAPAGTDEGNTNYFTILSKDDCVSLASEVPTTLQELSDLDRLGEDILESRGEKLVKTIGDFILENELQTHISDRPHKKQKINENGNSSTDKKTKKQNPTTSELKEGMISTREDSNIGDTFMNTIHTKQANACVEIQKEALESRVSVNIEKAA